MIVGIIKEPELIDSFPGQIFMKQPNLEESFFAEVGSNTIEPQVQRGKKLPIQTFMTAIRVSYKGPNGWEKAEERLPDYFKPFDFEQDSVGGIRIYRAVKSYVIEDEFLRQCLSDENKSADALDIVRNRETKLIEQISEYKKHPIKFMFSMLFRRKNER